MQLYRVKPRGPSTSTILDGSFLVIIVFRLLGGSRILILTSNGRDNGDAPTLDWCFLVVENDLVFRTNENAGARKSGMRALLSNVG